MKSDGQYLEIFLTPLRECRKYKPKLGHSSSNGYNLNQFLGLYQSDPFYRWIGLDSPYMFAAHKAAGGMTSIYRQIGIGCERLLRAILIDILGYNEDTDVTWSYEARTKSHKIKTLYLDGLIDIEKISNKEIKQNVIKWVEDFGKLHNLKNRRFRGIVFEVRQGYKSKDSKRQNADIDNATVAYANNLIPVFSVFSSQIDEDIVLRYNNNKCGILIGSLSDNPFVSLYSFFYQILKFDLSGFFERNSKVIRVEIQEILKILLSTKNE